MPASSSSFLYTSGGCARYFCIWFAQGSTPWNPKRAAILKPASGCGFKGVNMLVLIAQRNRSAGRANAFAAAAKPAAAPMNSRRVSMEPPVPATLDPRAATVNCRLSPSPKGLAPRRESALRSVISKASREGLMRLVSRLILCGLMASSLVRAQQAPNVPSPPALLTAEQDHKRIMDLLKISGFPPGANPNQPGHVQRSARQSVPDPSRSVDDEERPEGDDGRHVAHAPDGTDRRVRARNLRPAPGEHSEGELAGCRTRRARPMAPLRP